MPGTLYIVNGPLSCGKTSIAKALQNLLPEDNILLGMDAIHLSIPDKKLNVATPDPAYFSIKSYTLNGQPYKEIIHGPKMKALNIPRFQANCLYLNANISIISDEVFWQKEDLITCLRCYRSQQVYLFGLHVNDSEGSKRESGRSHCDEHEQLLADSDHASFSDDVRPVGLNRASEALIHRFIEYDFELDTSDLSIQACAEKIYHALANGLQANAFPRLLEKYNIEIPPIR